MVSAEGPSGAKFVRCGDGHVLLVMRPHPKDLDDAFRFEDLVDQAVLNINAAGVCAAQIPEEFLERRRSAKGIFGEDAEELFRFRAETRRSETARIFLRVLCEDDLPGSHQPGSL